MKSRRRVNSSVGPHFREMEKVIELIKVFPWWPLTVLFLAYLFRAEIRRAFGRLLQLKYREFEATFRNELHEAEVQVKDVVISRTKEVTALPESKPTDDKDEELARIADVSPRAAIVEAWRDIELATHALAEKYGVQGEHRIEGSTTIRALIGKGVLDNDFLSVYNRLRRLRSQAIHAPDFALEKDEAQRYIKLARYLANVMRALADQ
jgi:hypothetical protein